MFKEFLQKYNLDEKRIAVGVSGGSDSLALALMLNDELAPSGYNIIAVTVDHRLRPTSAQEAETVAKIMKQNNIEHHTLVWNKDFTPETGIEEAARIARYNLLKNWCEQNGVKVLMMAHHLNDQIETFFIRLQRGSGLDGLCGMQESVMHNNLQIMRPLLYTDPQIMKNYLKLRNITWIEDESNSCDDFLRVKIRKFLPQFYAATDITPKRIGETMQRLLSSRNYLEHKCEQIINNSFKNRFGYGYSCALSVFLSFDNEMAFRILARLLRQVGNNEYTPRAESVINLINDIRNSTFKSATLAHCYVGLSNKTLWILPENYNTGNYTRKAWEDYEKINPAIKKQKLPLRLRVFILNHLEVM